MQRQIFRQKNRRRHIKPHVNVINVDCTTTVNIDHIYMWRAEKYFKVTWFRKCQQIPSHHYEELLQENKGIRSQWSFDKYVNVRNRRGENQGRGIIIPDYANLFQ